MIYNFSHLENSFSSIKSKEIKHKFDEPKSKDKKKEKGKKDYTQERQRKRGEWL